MPEQGGPGPRVDRKGRRAGQTVPYSGGYSNPLPPSNPRPGSGLRNTGAGLVARNYDGSTNTWSDASGRKVGTSVTEDSPVAAFVKQRKRAGTKGY